MSKEEQAVPRHCKEIGSTESYCFSHGCLVAKTEYISEAAMMNRNGSIPAGEHIVMIVDDDQDIREALQELLARSNLRAVAFGSAAEYLAYPKPDVPACLILDVELPDGNGVDLLQEMGEGEGNHPAIIFVTNHGDIRSCVRAIKGGALDFLTKPFIEQELLTLVHAALVQDRERRANRAGLNRLQQLYRSLTPREREVLPLVVSGLLNKQAAAQLDIGEVTVRVHRGNVMRKMQADSLADLVRMAGYLKIPVAAGSMF
jgi:FixJ family two-component response regulator